MIKIDEKKVIINFKEYNSLESEIREKIENNKNVKLFFIKFTNNSKQDIKLLKQLKRKEKKYYGIDYNNYKLIGIVENENDEILSCIKAIFIEKKEKKYEFIYDSICNQLDKKWREEDPCKFNHNTCIYERQNKNPRENGCCYAFWYKNFGSQIYGVHQCEYLHPIEHCKNQNLSCKLFVCPYLRKHSNFKIEIKQLILVQVFFNRYQKIIIKNNFFIEKNKFLYKLKKDEHITKPLILYYICRDFLVYKNVPKNKKEIAKKYDRIYKESNGLRNK